MFIRGSILLLCVLAAAEESDFARYRKQVEPVFLKSRRGAARCVDCHALASHNSLLRLQSLDGRKRWTPEQSRKNYETVLKTINRAASLESRLLLHPLAEDAGGDPFHTGGKFWRSKNDPEWKRLAAWAASYRQN